MNGRIDVATQIGEALEESFDGLCLVMMIEVIGAKVQVFDAVAQHEVGGSEHGSSNGDDSFFGASTTSDAVELSREIAALATRGRPCGLDQCCL